MTIEEKAKAFDEALQKAKEWKSGVAGGSDRDTYLIRSSKGYYFTSSCCGGDDYYLELDSLEQLPGINEEE